MIKISSYRGTCIGRTCSIITSIVAQFLVNMSKKPSTKINIWVPPFLYVKRTKIVFIYLFLLGELFISIFIFFNEYLFDIQTPVKLSNNFVSLLSANILLPFLLALVMFFFLLFVFLLYLFLFVVSFLFTL